MPGILPSGKRRSVIHTLCATPPPQRAKGKRLQRRRWPEDAGSKCLPLWGPRGPCCNYATAGAARKQPGTTWGWAELALSHIHILPIRAKGLVIGLSIPIKNFPVRSHHKTWKKWFFLKKCDQGNTGVEMS